MDDGFLHHYAFARYFAALCMEIIFIRMIKQPLTKKSTRLVISLFWFSIARTPAGYLSRYIPKIFNNLAVV